MQEPTVIKSAQDVVGSESKVTEPSILKDFPKRSIKFDFIVILGSLLFVLLGILTGWFFSESSKENTTSISEQTTKGELKKEFGEVVDGENITEAEGILRKGGIKGEGTHYLEREGGESQNVYLASTAIDLESFVGKKVHIWGETLSAIYAPWLMDVVKVKILE